MTLATPENMKKYEAANQPRPYKDGTLMPRPAIAYSPDTGEQYSATSGDYWHMKDDEPLRDENGEPMILVVSQTTMTDALDNETGE
jgi:hypothetical protein